LHLAEGEIKMNQNADLFWEKKNWDSTFHQHLGLVGLGSVGETIACGDHPKV